MSASAVPATRRSLLAGIGVLGGMGLIAGSAEAKLGEPAIPDTPGDYFLKLTGIQGPSVRDGHEGELEPITFAWGATQLDAVKPGKGNAVLDSFFFAVLTGMQSAKLFEHLALGRTIEEAVFSCRRTIEGETSDFASLRMPGCLVSNYRCTPHPTQGQAIDVVELRLGAEPVWTVE